MAIVQRSEDALAQSVRCGGIEWATKRKPRKPILPKNNPRVYPKRERRKKRTIHSRGAATDRGKNRERSRFFLHPLKGVVLKRGNEYSVTKAMPKECQFIAFQEQIDSKK